MQPKHEIARVIHHALDKPKEMLIHMLSPTLTCNPTGIATKLENPPGMAKAVSSANVIS